MNKEAVISDTVHTQSHAPQTNKYKRVLLFHTCPKICISEEERWDGQDLHLYIARLNSVIIFMNPNLFKRIVINGDSMVSRFSLYCREVGTSALPLCEFMLTPDCQLEPILGDPRLSFKQPLLLYSPQLGSLFLSKEPDWGLGSVLWAK